MRGVTSFTWYTSDSAVLHQQFTQWHSTPATDLRPGLTNGHWQNEYGDRKVGFEFTRHIFML